jgi:ferredoxin-NADP reductase
MRTNHFLGPRHLGQAHVRIFQGNGLPDPSAWATVMARRGRAFYVSGPAAMVDEMAALLREMGEPDGQVRREVFTGY